MWFQRVGRVTERGHSNNGSVNMINHRFPTVSAVLVVMAVLGAPAGAADTPAHEVPAVATPGNVAEAEAILGAKLLICSTCHGDNGVPRNTATPVIWGQQENYLVKQMHDFQHGDRDSEVMWWMATALSPAELGRAATFFAKKNWPARPAGADAKSPPASVAVCEACHQQNLAGGLAAPRLAGQRYEYLIAAMHRYAEGGRTNNTDMMRIMEAIPSAEREEIARYIAGL
jgi:cytochrome c553